MPEGPGCHKTVSDSRESFRLKKTNTAGMEHPKGNIRQLDSEEAGIRPGAEGGF